MKLIVKDGMELLVPNLVFKQDYEPTGWVVKTQPEVVIEEAISVEDDGEKAIEEVIEPAKEVIKEVADDNETSEIKKETEKANKEKKTKKSKK